MAMKQAGGSVSLGIYSQHRGVNNTLTSPSKLWRHTWDAIQKLSMLIAIALAHKLVNLVLKWVTPPNMEKAFLIVEGVVWVLFALMYTYVCWETASAFVPWLQRRSNRKNAAIGRLKSKKR
jgi:hypothetical protein